MFQDYVKYKVRHFGWKCDGRGINQEQENQEIKQFSKVMDPQFYLYQRKTIRQNTLEENSKEPYSLSPNLNLILANLSLVQTGL